MSNYTPSTSNTTGTPAAINEESADELSTLLHTLATIIIVGLTILALLLGWYIYFAVMWEDLGAFGEFLIVINPKTYWFTAL